MKKYQVVLTEDQLRVYRDALEFYSRFLSGQADYLPNALEEWLWNCKIDKSKVIEKLQEAKEIIFPGLHPRANYGIGMKGIPEREVSYEMYREVLVYWDKKSREKGNENYSVYQNPTMRYSGQPLPEIKEVSACDDCPGFECDWCEINSEK